MVTRKYARRQVSWFRRYEAIDWLDYDDPRRLATAVARLAADGEHASLNLPGD